jgi:hypothetical protein
MPSTLVLSEALPTANHADTRPGRHQRGRGFLWSAIAATIAKMSTLDEPIFQIKAFSFHEVATQVHAVYVSFGSCKLN